MPCLKLVVAVLANHCLCYNCHCSDGSSIANYPDDFVTISKSDDFQSHCHDDFVTISKSDDFQSHCPDDFVTISKPVDF